MSNAAHEGHLVLLETLPWTATVSEATTGQFGLNVLHRDGQARRETLDDDHQGLTMGLSGGEETQHRGQGYR